MTTTTKRTTAHAPNSSGSERDGTHSSRASYTARNEPVIPRDAGARTPTAAPAMKRKRSLSNAMPTTLSFKELQRLNAMKMEIFGFAGWLASTLLYVLFLMWAYLPDATLRSYGLTYLPSKHWAVAVPAMIVMSYLFSIVLYKAINMKWTPTLDSYATVCDVHSVFLDDDALDAHAEAETPPMADIPLTQVNSYLFS